MKPNLTFTPEYHIGETKELSVDLGQKTVDGCKERNSFGSISACLDVARYTAKSIINKYTKFGTVETLPGLESKQKLLERAAIVH